MLNVVHENQNVLSAVVRLTLMVHVAEAGGLKPEIG